MLYQLSYLGTGLKVRHPLRKRGLADDSLGINPQYEDILQSLLHYPA